jgi:adenine nucleotide transporter 17
MQMSDDPSEKNMGVLDIMKRVIHEEGALGLYKGLNSKLIQSVLTSAFLFYAKEMLFDWSVWILVLAGARKSMN